MAGSRAGGTQARDEQVVVVATPCNGGSLQNGCGEASSVCTPMRGYTKSK